MELSKNEIVKSLNGEIVALLIKQLNKDFSSCGVLEIEENLISAPSLVESVIKIIGELNSNQPQRLKSLVYRVDIPESVVRKIYQTTLIEQFHEALGLAIIKRELQKINSRLNLANHVDSKT